MTEQIESTKNPKLVPPQLNLQGISDNNVAFNCSVESETDKALLLQPLPAELFLESQWVPKSQIVEVDYTGEEHYGNKCAVVVMSKWIAGKKEWL